MAGAAIPRQCFYSLHVFLSFLYRIRSCVLYVKMAAGPFSQRQKISMEQIFTVKYLKNKSLCHYFYTIICVAFFLCLQEIKTIIHISATNVHIKLIRRRTFLNGAVFPCREIHLRGISQMVQRRPPFRVAAEREAAGTPPEKAQRSPPQNLTETSKRQLCKCTTAFSFGKWLFIVDRVANKIIRRLPQR